MSYDELLAAGPATLPPSHAICTACNGEYDERAVSELHLSLEVCSDHCGICKWQRIKEAIEVVERHTPTDNDLVLLRPEGLRKRMAELRSGFWAVKNGAHVRGDKNCPVSS
jgi:hypothetical protein